MGGTKGRRQRKASAQLALSLMKRAHNRNLNEMLSSEEFKKNQKEYSKRISEQESRLLSRTVFITHVKDLRVEANLQALESFMASTYGPVIFCKRAKYATRGARRTPTKNQYPSARVQFKYQEHAEAIFGKCSLASYRGSPVNVFCPNLGAKRALLGSSFCVQPSQPYDGMLENTTLEIQTTGLSLGHWMPCEEDVWGRQNHEQDYDRERDCWIEVVSASLAPHLQIDMNKRTIELTLPDNTVAMIRFKALLGKIELCHEIGESKSYSLILSMKHLPSLLCGRRSVNFGGIDAEELGKSFGLKLKISHGEAKALFFDMMKTKQLKKCGILRFELEDLHGSRPIETIVTDARVDAKLSNELCTIHAVNQKIGILLQALLDNCRFCSFYAMNDVKDGRTLTETILLHCQNDNSTERTISTLERMLSIRGATRRPVEMFTCLLAECVVGLYQLPDHCADIPRIMLTPLRQIVQGFEVEVSNRILRKYGDRTGRKGGSCNFLRVQIADESGEKLYHQQLSDAVVASYTARLRRGLIINGRRYDFLAYSSSQLKEASIWMVHANNDLTAIEIRKRQGDFARCSTPSKYAARLGQCFSTTIGASHKASDISHSFIDENFSSVEGKPFSDGCGKIERKVLDRLLVNLPYGPINTLDVAIVQIRYGGAKGTLVAWPSSSMPTDICLRPSMEKFDAAGDRALEVCSIGKCAPYYLNRNIILLLGVHGVPDETFMEMQEAMLSDLNLMLVDREKAIEMLEKLSGLDSGSKSRLSTMLHSGMCPSHEPFIQASLRAARTYQLFGLRKKARIWVEKGVSLMGGIDETGELPEGSVFLQLPLHDVSRSSGVPDVVADYKIIVGPVMITKHPVMHPGDVRMALAVHIPALKEHRNVLLFSRKGSRPLADMMAGSDLDGDEYAVTWDTRLFMGEWRMCRHDESGKVCSTKGDVLPMRRDCLEQDALTLSRVNALPLDYEDPLSCVTQPEALAADEDERSEQLLQYFFDFAKNDILGALCMLWQDWAAKYGADCNECIQLAAEHSIAVDFAKSGRPASIPDKCQWSGRRAHWKEKKSAASYHCDKILGRLYDKVSERLEEALPNVGKAGRKMDAYGNLVTSLGDDLTSLKDVYNPRVPACLGWENESSKEVEDFLDFAMEQRSRFDIDVMALMNRYGIRSEGELFSGCIRKFHKMHKKRQFNVSEAVKRECSILICFYRMSFFEEVLDFVRSIVGSEFFPSELIDGDRKSLEWVEQVTTSFLLPSKRSVLTQALKRSACLLCAAYYTVTYNPDRWDYAAMHHRTSGSLG